MVIIMQYRDCFLAALKDGNAALLNHFISTKKYALDESVRACLMQAVYVGEVDVLARLMSAKADVGVSPRPGVKNSFASLGPLIGAALFDDDRTSSKMVALLLSAKADPNAKRSNGNGSAMSFVSTKHPITIKQLLESKADPNVPDDNDCALVHRAASSSCVELLKLLILAKADCSSSNKKGKTPLDIAKNRMQKYNDPTNRAKTQSRGARIFKNFIVKGVRSRETVALLS